MDCDILNYYTPNKEYKVLVLCFTYNQSCYIKDALNGFAIQKTDFPFVCLVMDDASLDGEQEVIKNWMSQECNMNKAKCIDTYTSKIIIVPHATNKNCTFSFYFLKQNLYRESEKKLKHVYPWRQKCEYEAMCEGDDYWIDPQKLQKQVDFLDKNHDYSFSSTAVQLYDSNTNKKIGVACVSNNVATFETTDAIKGFGHVASTPSFLFRSNIITGNLPTFFKIAPCGDYSIPILASFYGKIVNLPDETSVHRVLSKESITSTWVNDFSRRKEYNIRFEKMLDELDRYTKQKYHKYIEEERFGLWFRSYLAAGKYSKIRNMKALVYMLKQPNTVRFKLLGNVYFPCIYNNLRALKHGK